MMKEPKFKPGDLLTSVLHPGIDFQVIESQVQICPGGTQINYACRGCSKDGLSSPLTMLNEIELRRKLTSDRINDIRLLLCNLLMDDGDYKRASAVKDVFDSKEGEQND